MKRYNKFLMIFAIFCSLIMTVGCGGQKLPPGMPTLYPCSVKVMQAGTPLEGAKVLLDSQDSSGGTKWIVGGLTDKSGIAKLRTNGNLIGVPLGNYKVLISKFETEGVEATTMENYGKQNPKTYDLVDLAYGQADSTPLSATVSESNKIQEFNVGEAVRIEKNSINPLSLIR